METIDLTGISQITQDSRAVKKGALFVALRGEKVDAVQFIHQAEQMGAVAVLVADDVQVPETNMRIIRSKEPRRALAQIAAQFTPDQPTHMVAVTGTDGKTSTADFYRQLVHLCGGNSASIGTIGTTLGDGKKLHDATHTTPGAIALHELLSELTHKGVTHACMEASSHGLDQYRMHGVKLEAAAFTNIARDHLDYHKNEEDYFRAKLKLFTEILPEGGTAIINADDKRAPEVTAACKARGQRVIDFGLKAEALKILWIIPHVHELEMRCNFMGDEQTMHIPLVGAFQGMNLLAAMGLCMTSGLTIAQMLEVVPKLQGVPGRLQLAALHPSGASVFVDYAHTPAALANILKTLRAHTKNKLHVVFGCGGNRDVGKRPQMGQAAHMFADVIYVTDDNPRNETPHTIREAIMAACPKAIEVADRAQAIRQAIQGLAEGDVLVIAGKGHEKIQIIGNVEHPHDDVHVAQEALKSL
jgi:UDP-N-acetylmuramoyl-L-alanyl-D-glutamate--2,6-diaminopimelate ligase